MNFGYEAMETGRVAGKNIKIFHKKIYHSSSYPIWHQEITNQNKLKTNKLEMCYTLLIQFVIKRFSGKNLCFKDFRTRLRNYEVSFSRES